MKEKKSTIFSIFIKFGSMFKPFRLFENIFVVYNVHVCAVYFEFSVVCYQSFTVYLKFTVC